MGSDDVGFYGLGFRLQIVAGNLAFHGSLGFSGFGFKMWIRFMRGTVFTGS